LYFFKKEKANGKLESFKNDFMERETIFNQAIITDVNNIFLFFQMAAIYPKTIWRIIWKTKVKTDKVDRFSDLNGQSKISDKWNWYTIIQTFITRLNMKMDEVYQMNYISSLNWLSFWYEENKVKENINKQR